MSDLRQYEIKLRHKLSAEMYLALCYTAQNHHFRGYTHGRTLNALRRRRLVDKENELTNAGWECYIELTDAGPCGTSGSAGWSPKDPRLQYEAAKPRLDEISSKKANSERRRRKPDGSNELETASNETRSGIFRVEEIRYGGRLIVLDDGSRWEVGEADSYVSESWSKLDHVIVINDEMYKLDDSEKVSVAQDG